MSGPWCARYRRVPGRNAVDDTTTMEIAIRNAATVRGSTAPNPWVGAVVTAVDGAMFEGATTSPGGPHAEMVALAEAGQRAAGGTLTVTLEPCVHHGRTPPCTDAIVAAGIRRVVVGIEDSDPRVADRGIAALRAAGLDGASEHDPARWPNSLPRISRIAPPAGRSWS